MNRFFSIFCSLGVFLVFSILAACDSGGGGGGGGDDKKSSSSRFVPSQSLAAGDGSIEETEFIINPFPQYVKIKLDLKANHPDSVLKKVEITIDGKIINPNPSLSRFYSYEEEYDFTGTEFCDEKVYVCYKAALGGKETEVEKCRDFTRTDPVRCHIPSSSSEEPSSSSAIPVVSKTLVPMFDGEVVKINTVTGYKGINLRAGEATSTQSEADFYLNSNDELVAKSGVNIVETFDRGQCESPRQGFGTIKNDCVPNPTNTNRFVFKPEDSGESIINYVYLQYYMVRLSNTTEWNNDCYLVYASGIVSQQGNNQSVEIKVWKVE